MTDTHNRVDQKTQAHDFETLLKGRVDDSFIKNHVKQQSAAYGWTKYPATGSVASLVFGLKIACQITNGKQFQKWIWGAAIPGGGALFGDVYTNDLNSLYNNVASVAATFTSVYTAFYWYDANGFLLGEFQAGSISTVSGAAGASCSPSDWT